MAGGRRRLLRRLPQRRRRMPHGVPFPRHATHLHGRAQGIPLPGLGNPRQDPGHSLQLPMGHLPAQPRRAHARNGHGRRTRLHVRGVRQRPAYARQHRHPPPARPAPGQRPQPDRTVHRPAAVPARLADPLLRRRDRHGRQHLARRPRRGADTDAVDAGPQRGLLLLRPGAAVAADDHGSGLRLPGHQRRGVDVVALVAAALDAPDDRDPQAEPGVRPRLVHRTPVVEPGRPRLPGGRRPRPRRTGTTWCCA